MTFAHLAQAFNLHKRDTGQFPIYANDTDADNDTESATVLAGTGTEPALGSSGWLITSTGSIDAFLNANNLGLPTTARGGRITYRGPYVDLITADPWGNQYLVNADNLRRGETTNVGYVISAGPNGTLETALDQSSLSIGGDDIVAQVN